MIKKSDIEVTSTPVQNFDEVKMLARLELSYRRTLAPIAYATLADVQADAANAMRQAIWDDLYGDLSREVARIRHDLLRMTQNYAVQDLFLKIDGMLSQDCAR